MSSGRFGVFGAGLLITLALAFGGYKISDTLYKVRFADRSLTAKGFSERDVKSDLGVWTMSVSVKGNDIGEMLEALKSQKEKIVSFLTNKGLAETDVRFENLYTTDLQSSMRADMAPSSEPSEQPKFRYNLGQQVKIRSFDVDAITNAVAHESELVATAGLVIGWSNVSYYFTKLDTLRPTMLSESIKSAQTIAAQMAKDCGGRLGKIRTLNQGVFSITAQDQNSGAQGYDDNSSLYKKVRIVSTLTYFLEG